MKTTITVIAFSLLAAGGCIGAAPNLIPQPVKMEPVEGRFKITEETRLVSDPAFSNEAGFLKRQWESAAGHPLRSGGDGGAVIRLVKAATPIEGPEAYSLAVSPDGITLTADDPAGMFRGIQTLLQLMPPSGATELPCVKIQDAPRFAWRGLMLDCSRTFQSIDYLKKTIDRMAAYKLNVLHLHLTDDQGWRMEIKKHPELTEKGARFSQKYNEPPEHQGFYTQDQLRDLVAYAAARHITVVPEIEMPGHSHEVLVCHPELSCAGEIADDIFPYDRGPGRVIREFCAGEEGSFRLLEDVLDEVIAVFPSEFIHIGGDEAKKEHWKNCPKCQARMRENGLKSEEELQSWFMRRIGEHVRAKGRRIIGWSEILQGGLPPGAAVMDWKGGAADATGAGRDVVMAPQTHVYLSRTYAQIPTQRVYGYDPVAGLSDEQSRHVLGLQSCFWSHINREPEQVDAKLFPRLLALAERAWSPASRTDWPDFRSRLLAHFPRIQDLHPWPWDLEPLAGEWDSKDFPESGTLEFDVSDKITSPGTYRVMPTSHGDRAATIHAVELYRGEKLAARDIRKETLDVKHESSRPWILDVREVPAGQTWRLRITMTLAKSGKSSGGRFLLQPPQGNPSPVSTPRE